MRKIITSGIAVSALLASATALYAQTPAPGADELRRQPAAQGTTSGLGGTTTAPQNRPGAATQGSGAASGAAATGQGMPAAQGSGTAQGSGSAQTGDGKAGTTAQGSGSATGSGSAQGGDAKAGTTAQGAGSTGGGASGSNAAQSGSGSSNTNVNVNITTEQRTTIRREITTAKVEPAREVNFNISVGIAVPRTIVLHPLPSRVVELVPAYRSYQYFLLADGRIVIVEPGTLRIVAILTA